MSEIVPLEADGAAAGSALVRKSVKRTLLGMAVPMLAGTFAMNAYHLTDTWFVSRLGTPALAAMGFTFSIVMLLGCVAGGLGSAVTILASHAIGRRDHSAAAKIVTHGMALTVMVSAIMSAAGYLGLEAVFRRLGADAAILALIGEYMRTWYAGAVFMFVPMMGNGILLSAGDSRMAARVMMLGPIINTVLDPVMIFGFAGFPAMGMKGAALATVIAQAASAFALVALLQKKHKLLVFKRGAFHGYSASVRKITAFGVPGILTMILMPISAAVITRLLGGFGAEAVAAAGAAGRVEMFAFVIPMALGISLTPFVSQNYGAVRFDRIRTAKSFSMWFAAIYGGAVAVLFFLFAPGIAAIFSNDPKVKEIIVSYIRIIPFGYGMMEIHRYCGFFLTGLHKPVHTTVLNAFRILAVLLPLSWAGAHFFGIRGLFFGRLATDFIVGAAGLFWVHRVWKISARHAAHGTGTV